MKYILTSLLTFLVSFGVYSQIDYTYCSKFISDANANIQKTGFAYPFVIDAQSGKLQTINNGMDYTQSPDGTSTYSSSGWAGTATIAVHKGSQSDIGSVEVTLTSQAPGAPSKVTSTINFNIVNGKCVPQVGHNETTFKGEKINTTIFDMNLCRDIEKFFNANSDIKKCFDLDSSENKAIRKIFDKNGYEEKGIVQQMTKLMPAMQRYGNSVEQRIFVGSKAPFDVVPPNTSASSKRLLGMSGGSPLISSYMILNDCYERGFEQVLSDDHVWRKEDTRPDSTKQETIQK